MHGLRGVVAYRHLKDVSAVLELHEASAVLLLGAEKDRPDSFFAAARDLPLFVQLVLRAKELLRVADAADVDAVFAAYSDA